MGKSHLAAALGMRAIKNGFRTVHYTFDGLIRLLRADEAARPARPHARRYRNSALLIIDEVGFRPLDRTEANLFLRLVCAHYEREFADPDLEQACSGLAGDLRRGRGADYGDPGPAAPPCPCGLDPGA